jgi:hypothetical protein
MESEYEDLAMGRRKPRTISAALRVIREKWAPFLAVRGRASEDVTIHDLIAWEQDLVHAGFNSTDLTEFSLVRGYYRLKGSRYPDSKWSKLAGEIAGHELPETIGRVRPHLPFDLLHVPLILEAARRVHQFNVQGQEVYSEAYAVTATFLYSAGRAQFYGLRVDQVEDAIKTKVLGKNVDLYVKTGKSAEIPMHDRLLEIWKEHLDKRDFDGPMLFRHGLYPYTYQEGNLKWEEDVNAADRNLLSVQYLLRASPHSVARALASEFKVKERLTAHRFRKTLGTALEDYGFTKAERNLLGAWEGEGMAEEYSMPNLLRLQKKWSTVDYGDESWLKAHWPPRNLFAGANGNEDLVAQLQKQLAEEKARSDRLEAKLDRILANQKVIA